MPIDFETFSVTELKAMQKEMDKEIKEKEKEHRIQVIKKLEQLAKEEGYDLYKLLGTKKAKKVSGGKLPPKYKDPNSDKTWSGKGPAPKWAKPYKEQDRMGELEI